MRSSASLVASASMPLRQWNSQVRSWLCIITKRIRVNIRDGINTMLGNLPPQLNSIYGTIYCVPELLAGSGGGPSGGVMKLSAVV